MLVHRVGCVVVTRSLRLTYICLLSLICFSDLIILCYDVAVCVDIYIVICMSNWTSIYSLFYRKYISIHMCVDDVIARVFNILQYVYSVVNFWNGC